ncbi:MAG: hypothetical protein ACRCSN_12135, partial [Dermatophilaceae bacterium]
MTLRHNRLIRGAAALSVSAALAAVAAGPATAAVAPEEPRSLAEVLAADGRAFDEHHDDFDIVDAAVAAVLEAKPDSPLAVLADPDAALTAFLPQDNGFITLAYAYDPRESVYEPELTEEQAFGILAE